jgi:colicin import membrane protein
MNLTTCIMYRLSSLRACSFALLMSFMLASLAWAQDAAPGAQAATPSSLAQRYPAGAFQSVEAADHALEETKRERTRIEAQFAQEERACYPKFFTASCLQEAKERRRRALAQLRSIEIDANGYKRRERVVERDKALAEKQAKDEVDAPRREQERQQKEAELLQKSANKDAGTESRESADEAHRADAGKRVAAHEAKLKRQAAEDAANAQQRAENIAAYEKKVQEAQQRQREIAAKKAEKQQ